MPKTPKNLEKKVTFRLKAEDYEFFKELAEKEGHTVSSAVRLMVMNSVINRKRLLGLR